MKKITFLVFIFIFIFNITVSAGLIDGYEMYVKIKVDKMTGKTLITAKENLVVADNNEGSLSLFPMVFKNEVVLSITVNGASPCVDDGGKAYILFRDGSRLIIQHSTGFNCRKMFNAFLVGHGVAHGTLAKLIVKDIEAMRLHTVNGFVQVEFTKEQSKTFKKTIESLYNIITKKRKVFMKKVTEEELIGLGVEQKEIDKFFNTPGLPDLDLDSVEKIKVADQKTFDHFALYFDVYSHSVEELELDAGNGTIAKRTYENGIITIDKQQYKTIEYTYNSNKFIVKEVIKNIGDIVVKTDEYEYDNDRLTKKITKGRDDELEQTINYVYTKSGRVALANVTTPTPDEPDKYDVDKIDIVPKQG